MGSYYTGLHESGKVDPQDIVSEYAVPEQIAAYTEEQTKHIKVQLLDAKQKECNMLMVVGW